MKAIAILLARGGSKGIPKKNILKINNIPLINYTIQQCLESGIDEIYTSSDDQNILKIAKQFGSKTIIRPDNLANDFATSESGWIHALANIPNIDFHNDWIFAPQLTSPIREPHDIKKALNIANTNKFDSIFSATKFEDFFIWENTNNNFVSLNYDYRNRLRRQDINDHTYLENGSFYLFKPYGIKKFNNRLYGKIGISEMDKTKMFQLDTPEDIPIIENMLRTLKIEIKTKE